MSSKIGVPTVLTAVYWVQRLKITVAWGGSGGEPVDFGGVGGVSCM